jgi:mRNA interferase YafQ
LKMLKPEYTARFKKDLKTIQKRNMDKEMLKEIITKLCNEEALPAKNYDNSLSGEWAGCRECHIAPDWLLIYQVGNGIIIFERTGSHSDLF